MSLISLKFRSEDEPFRLGCTYLFQIEGYLDIPYQNWMIESREKVEQQPMNMAIADNPFVKAEMTVIEKIQFAEKKYIVRFEFQ